MGGALLRLGGRGGRAQPSMELGQWSMPPLTVLLKGLWLHHLATMTAHHQEEVIVAWVQAKDGHVWREETGGELQHCQNNYRDDSRRSEPGVELHIQRYASVSHVLH